MSSTELCLRTKRCEPACLVPVKDGHHSNQNKTPGRSEKSEQCANEVTTSQNRNITELNDNCLLETFSHMQTIDLCAVKGCCSRFSYLAESVVEKRFRSNGYLEIPNTYCTASAILVAFGKFITDLRVSDVKPWLGEDKCKIAAMLKLAPRLNRCCLRSRSSMKVIFFYSDQTSFNLTIGDTDLVCVEFGFISKVDIVECMNTMEKLELDFSRWFSNYDFKDRRGLSIAMNVLVGLFNEFPNLEMLTVHVCYCSVQLRTH